MSKTRNRKNSRYITVSQLSCGPEDGDAVLAHAGLERFICTVTQADHCHRSRISCPQTALGTPRTVADLLALLLLFQPELTRAGLDVVVLDEVQGLAPGDIDRISQHINRLMDAGMWVVAWNRADDFVELSSFRDVVCTDDFIRIILRDFMPHFDEIPAIKASTRKQSALALHERRSLAISV